MKDFKDYGPLQSHASWVGMKDANFLQSHVLVYSKDDPTAFLCSEQYRMIAPVRVCLKKKTVPRFDLGSVQLHNKYPSVVPLTPEILRDVRVLSTYVPVEYKMFFDDLIAAQELLLPSTSAAARRRVRGRVEDDSTEEDEDRLEDSYLDGA
ncbi:hypothetical protein E2C01_099426 [Portunus trituberculatus]|uniref:Uncharacterized protein n=1 Tax=Portunus trituberculatus TaxID=210409 RepID=A0A5B7K0B5_PORTR|nr:hypothetical protein [Portunus trituberculatus]